MPGLFDAFTVLAILVFGLFSEIFRRHNLKLPVSSRPPIVPSWLPWVGNAVQYGKNPNRFLERCRKTHGPAFTALLAGTKITFIVEPSLISAMFRNSKDLLLGPVRAEVQQRAFAASRQGSLHSAIEGEVFPTAFHHFSKSSMSETSSGYSRRLLESFRSMRTSSSSRHISLWDLVFPTLYACSAKAAFGDSFPESTFSDFVKFDEGITLHLSPVPAFFTGPYDAARSRLITAIVQWTNADKKKTHTPSGVSQLVVEAVETMQLADFPASDIGAQLLSLLWGTQANTMWTVFWYLAYILQEPEHARRLRNEIEDTLSARFGGSIEALIEADPAALSSNDFVLLESGFRETMRLTSSVIIARQVVKDVTLHARTGAPTQLVEGEIVFVTPHIINMNPDIFEDPTTFRLDRFVAGHGKALHHPTINGRLMPYNLLTWGGGTNMCKGRFIAQYQAKMFVAMVLHFFDIPQPQVVNRATRKPVHGRPLPKVDEICFGVMHSAEDMMCHLTSR